MNRLFYQASIFLFIIFLLCSPPAFTQGYELKVKIENYNSNELFLGYRLGAKTYIADTATATDKNKDGYFVFKGVTPKHPGVYLIICKPDNNYFEFLLPDTKNQQFTLTAIDGKDLSANWTVSGSPENSLFKDYLMTMTNKGEQTVTLEEKIKTAGTVDKQKLEKEVEDIDLEKLDYMNNVVKNNAGTFLASLIRANKNPIIPESIRKQGNDQGLRYYKKHYFDDVNLADDRLLYSPVIEGKVETYLEKLTVANPDSVIQSVDKIISLVKTAGDKEVYKTVVIQLMNKYARSKIICMDKVYVHIGSVYYCGTITPGWIDPEELKKICDKTDELRLTLCGAKAPQIKLMDVITEQPINLYTVQSPYTAVFFWDPGQQYSEKQATELVKVYLTWKNKGLDIFGIAVSTKAKNKAGIEKLGITWKNGDSENEAYKNIKKQYGISSYPKLLLLDNQKKILYKSISVKQLEDILVDLNK